jgi:hypothetical protein
VLNLIFLGVEPEDMLKISSISLSNPFFGGRVILSVPLAPSISGHLLFEDEKKGEGDSLSLSLESCQSPVPHAIFSELLMKHSQVNELRGILLAFAKARFVDENEGGESAITSALRSIDRGTRRQGGEGGGGGGGGGGEEERRIRYRPVGRILGAIPIIHTRVSAEVLVFRPQAGQILKGIVSHASSSHIAILVLGLFTASVLKSDMANGYIYQDSIPHLHQTSSVLTSSTSIGGGGGKRSRSDMSKGEGDVVEDMTDANMSSKKSKKLTLKQQMSNDDIEATTLIHDISKDESRGEGVGGRGGGAWVKISNQETDKVVKSSSSSSTTLFRKKERKDGTISSKQSLPSSSSSSSSSLLSMDKNRILANNPERIQEGIEIFFSVLAVFNSAGVLTIQGSFVDKQ